MKKRIIIAGVIILAVVLLIYFAIRWLPILFFMIAKPAKFFPTEGTWYCEELQLNLKFGMNESSTAVVDGEEIDCVAGFMEGSKQVTVSAQDFDTDKLKPGALIFPGEFVSLSDSELVLRHRSTGELFVFVKIERQGTVWGHGDKRTVLLSLESKT